MTIFTLAVLLIDPLRKPGLIEVTLNVDAKDPLCSPALHLDRMETGIITAYIQYGCAAQVLGDLRAMNLHLTLGKSPKKWLGAVSTP
jgi:hypothetical protein